MAQGFGNLGLVIEQIDTFVEGVDVAALRASNEMAEEIGTLARDTYCPIDTGDLRSTFRIVAEVSEPELATAQILVGGADSVAPYSTYVHERLDLRHAPPTQAKFLERATTELGGKFATKVGEGIVSAAQRAGR